MQKKWKIETALVLFLVFISAAARGGTLEDIQEKYSRVKDFTVSFDQNTFQSIVNKNITFTGKISYIRDAGVRMDVASPERQIIILKGNTVWIYLPEQGTSSIQEVPEEFASRNLLSFFAGLGSIQDDYNLEEKKSFLILHPKKGTGSISIQVDDQRLIRRILLEDATGNHSDMSLHGYRFDQGLPNSLLETKTPADGLDKQVSIP